MLAKTQIKKDSDSFVLSDALLAKIIYLYQNNGDVKVSSIIFNNISKNEMKDIIESIVLKTNASINDFLLLEDDSGYNKFTLSSLILEYQKCGDVLANIIDNDFLLSYLEYIINLIYMVNKELERFYLFLDLSKAYPDVIKNLECFENPSKVASFKKAYLDAIKNSNIEGMLSLLDGLNKEIRKEWKNLPMKLDDDFTFIGHSTDTSSFTDKFKSRYVSCSLFNSSLIDTYREGFGFIMDSDNVYRASSNDMYVVNYMDSLDDGCSSLVKLDHPKKVLEETLARKDEEESVYNEVLLDGFKPIGIFCFTDGSLDFNRNYRMAYELKKSFPNLEVYAFDVLSKLKGNRLNRAKLNLINQIRLKLGLDVLTSVGGLYRYQYFFDEFAKLKKSKYQIEDILGIFKKNEMLLSSRLGLDALFSGSFNDSLIKYVLLNNPQYNIASIFKGEATLFSFSNLLNLEPYIDKAESLFPGIKDLLGIIDKIFLDKDDIDKINHLPKINFLTIFKFLLGKKKVDELSLDKKDELAYLYLQEKSLASDVRSLEEQNDLYRFYTGVLNASFRISLIKSEHASLLKKITRYRGEYTIKKDKMDKIESDLDTLQKRRDVYIEMSYKKTSRHKEYMESLLQYNSELDSLASDPMNNREELEYARDRIITIKIADSFARKAFLSYKELNVSNIDNKILKIREARSKILGELLMILGKIETTDYNIKSLEDFMFKHFNTRDVDRLDSILLEAKDFVFSYDEEDSFTLLKLKSELSKVRNEISSLEDNYVPKGL